MCFSCPRHIVQVERAAMANEAVDDNDEAVRLLACRSNIVSILRASAHMDKDLAGVDARLSLGLDSLDAFTDAVAPLQSQAIATKALHARINRAVSPALSLLRSFALVESLQRRLLRLSSRTSSIPRLLDFLDCVDRLREAVAAVTAGCKPAVQRLHEAVEFLSRTRATDQLRIRRLRETMEALEKLYEAEVDGLRYDGSLDDALLRLQNDYEAILDRLKHRYITASVPGGDGSTDPPPPPVLGSDLEIEALRRISEILASNDCLDICIDIFVKVRYRRAAKALMRLSPEYLRTYGPEEIDGMKWEALEAAISLWIDHFEVAVRLVFAAEKRLCSGALGGVLDGAVWPECFAKIADRIMAVFFRFGEGVARSANEPHKLFKLLDMLDALDRIRPAFINTFDGEAGEDIRARCRELQKLLVHAAAKAFWELGLQIEGLQDRAPQPADGSVPKIVRYAVNYLKCLAAGGYATAMERVLRTEAAWKAGPLAARPDAEEDLLRDALSNVLEALRRNVEAKRGEHGSRDRVVPHVMAMNAYWYIYMRTRGSELAALVGEETMRRRYKTAAEEAAYSYQAEAWGPLVRLLTERRDVDSFMRGLEENLRRHRSDYCIQDGDLREQIKEAVAKVVVEAYAGFLHANAGVLVEGRVFLPPDSIKRLLGRLFDGGGGEGWRRETAA
ncbi:exocyst complex component EXO70I [Elaeis guineensis]|uniref:exocyst complex component EXO70I n=1 Tax=Elaeis guineensis var. tenera TaxID=51953 RepID=UPI003C6CE6BC